MAEVDLSELQSRLEELKRVSGSDAEVIGAERAAINARSSRRRFAILWTLLSIIGYFVGSIRAQRYKFPDHFAWWDLASAEEEAPRGDHFFGMYQVATAAFHTPVQTLVNASTYWTHLTDKGARFLLFCVSHFELHHPATRGKLRLVHWAGSGEQTNVAEIFGPGGVVPCGTDLEARRRHIKSRWVALKNKNPWFDFFPDPREDEAGFFRINVVRELESAACTSTVAYLRLYRLFDGGLCNIAHSEITSDDSAVGMFEAFFGRSEAAEPSACSGVAEAAVAGAALAGSSSLAMSEGMEFLAQNTGQFSQKFQTGFAVGVVLTTVVSAVGGGALAATRQKESCSNVDIDRRNAEE